MKKMKKGFTLVELLVVMAILGILASVAFGQYRNSQKKARDAQRKSDLDNIARALEMYYNDNDTYPEASPEDLGGKISVDGGVIDWTGSFQKEVGDQTIIYMKRLPKDPDNSFSYCYSVSEGGDGYTLYTRLENDNDMDYCLAGYSCGIETDTYRYNISSSNEAEVCGDE